MSPCLCLVAPRPWVSLWPGWAFLRWLPHAPPPAAPVLHTVLFMPPPARDSHRHAPHSVPREEGHPCQKPSAHLPPCLASPRPPPSRGSHSTAGSFAVNKTFEDRKKKKKKVRAPHYLSVIEIISVKQFHKLDPGHSLEMPFQWKKTSHHPPSESSLPADSGLALLPAVGIATAS